MIDQVKQIAHWVPPPITQSIAVENSVLPRVETGTLTAFFIVPRGT